MGCPCGNADAAAELRAHVVPRGSCAPLRDSGRQSHQAAARKLRRCALAAAVFSISAQQITRDNGRCQTDWLLLVVPARLMPLSFARSSSILKSIPLLFLSVGRIIRRIKIARFWTAAFGNRVQKRELNRSDARGM